MSDPAHVSISKSSGVKIDWKDGHHSEYSLKYLRAHCPCASCAGAHGQPPKPKPASPFQMYTPPPKIESVEPAGNYGIRIKWNDGHSAGIYSYQLLREICPCPECAARR